MENKNSFNNKLIILITLVASLGGLLFGYDTAVISGAVGAMNSFFINPLDNDNVLASGAIIEFKSIISIVSIGVLVLFGYFLFKFFKKITSIAIIIIFLLIAIPLFKMYFLDLPDVLTENLRNSILGFMTSSALVGCILGASFGDFIANSVGRRNGLVIAAVLFLISALGSGYPEAFNVFGIQTLSSFIIYRIIGGMGVGIASMLAPLYIAEMAPANIRGKMVSCNQLAIVTGMLVVYFVNYFIVQGQPEAWIADTGWRYMFLSEVIPAFLFFVLLLFMPKTPRFEVMKGNEEKAKTILDKLNVKSSSDRILSEIKNSFKTKKAHWLFYGWPVIIVGLLLSVFQQFVGINVVLYYAPEIFKGMGVDTNASMLQTIIVGAINMIFTVIAIMTVDNFGRKKLLLIGSVVMGISMIGLGFSLFSGAVGFTSLLLMLVYIAAFAVSWGPVTWVLLSEIFPNSIKGVMAVAVAVQWLANLVISWTFPIMNNNPFLVENFNHGFSYWVYGAFAVISAIFVWKFVPETKGRSLEDMEQLWLKKEQE
ncbi:MFS transporter, SP family, xylose:H+ symportor [Zunongwangia mangrovi]|uniref:MFS transporter, SP family, xylose:H+ symportor n=1 Tax=Zunongwangia mangrovi TaxID=1334022 RepID=A0A1I1N0X2_9FLAO|nr:D-xylose transporter XylE [Zunongwangia mangrovi]SFC91277.1 MFS transporter, SP family, xylose:H+ symportor [Zunongwangia mangrovi]